MGSSITPFEARQNLEALETVIDRLAAKQEECDAIKSALSALVAKLDECDPHMTSAFSWAYIHGHVYSGPTYTEELEAARKVLEGKV